MTPLERRLLGALEEVADELDGMVDVVDGENGPQPNWAMRLMDTVIAAITAAKQGGQK